MEICSGPVFPRQRPHVLPPACAEAVFITMLTHYFRIKTHIKKLHKGAVKTSSFVVYFVKLFPKRFVRVSAIIAITDAPEWG